MTDFRANDEFKTTHWSLVVASREDDSDVRRTSLGELCEAYWYPLFAYLRRKGYTPDKSADYVQSFFVELIEKDFLEAVSPDKGRFRWFLMSAIKRYVGKEVEKQNAQKRGGGRQLFSLDIEDAEHRYQLEPTDGWTAENLFDRRWAMSVLQQALKQLEKEQQAKGKIELYQALQPSLSGVQMTQAQYENIAEKFSMTPGAVKVAALRLREKYRKTMQDVVAQTMMGSDDVEDELTALLKALRGPQ